MNIFFTSDLHFGHTNVLKYCNRPWKTVEEMNEGLIQNWNKTVRKDDVVYMLGDFCLTSRIELVDGWLGRLNGRLRILAGNHDRAWLKKVDRLTNGSKIEWVKQYHKENFTVDGKNYEIVMMHFPFLSWDGSARGALSLHGHAHGSNDHLNRGTKRLDVGVDAEFSHLRPLSLREIIDITAHGGAVDHHDL